jgi:hypothetical protein
LFWVHEYVPLAEVQSAFRVPVYVQSLPSLLFVLDTETLLPMMLMVSVAVTPQECWSSVNIEPMPCRVHVLGHSPRASVSFQTVPRGSEQVVELEFDEHPGKKGETPIAARVMAVTFDAAAIDRRSGRDVDFMEGLREFGRRTEVLEQERDHDHLGDVLALQRLSRSTGMGRR